MNLDLIRPKKELEGLLFSITKNCEGLLNKLIGNYKKHWNLNLPDQVKHFLSNHQSQLKDNGINKFGCIQPYFWPNQKKLIKLTFIKMFLTSYHLQN